MQVILPCADVATEAEREPVGDATKAAESVVAGGTVLVADDEEMVRDVTQMALEMAGVTVLLAEDGEEAVRLFEQRADEIAVVLLDMSMPRMSGQEALTAIRSIRSDVPVLLSSGFDEQDSTDRLVEHDLAGFIQKPYRPTELIEKVKAVLGD